MATTATAHKPRRTQADRTAETKQRLIEAAVACLVEDGYAQTTAVNICTRAGLTRGAYHHHYSSTAELFVDALEWLFTSVLSGGPGAENQHGSIEAFLREGWTRMKRPEFKAVIELWLASRNDPSVGKDLATAIGKFSQMFAPQTNPELAARLGANPEALRLYRLAFEAMIGLALGRATSPGGAAVAHEDDVVDTLLALAREHDRGTEDDTR